jgi:hypothetical protein
LPVSPQIIASDIKEYLVLNVQVLHLLDRLNMPQYKDSFRREMVDGEILSEIDEVVLEQELAMTSKIHRLRLMKYIESHKKHNTHLKKEL